MPPQSPSPPTSTPTPSLKVKEDPDLALGVKMRLFFEFSKGSHLFDSGYRPLPFWWDAWAAILKDGFIRRYNTETRKWEILEAREGAVW